MLGKDSKTKSLLSRIRRKGNKGFVSLLILLVLIFLAWTGYEVFSKASSQERIVRYEAQRIRALYLADSGLEWACSSLAEDPDWPGGLKAFSSGEVRVEVEGGQDDHEYTVKARAESGQAVQSRFGVFCREENGVLMLKNYGEMFN